VIGLPAMTTPKNLVMSAFDRLIHVVFGVLIGFLGSNIHSPAPVNVVPSSPAPGLAKTKEVVPPVVDKPLPMPISGKPNVIPELAPNVPLSPPSLPSITTAHEQLGKSFTAGLLEARAASWELAATQMSAGVDPMVALNNSAADYYNRQVVVFRPLVDVVNQAYSSGTCDVASLARSLNELAAGLRSGE
jgi:hypothetical protein